MSANFIGYSDVKGSVILPLSYSWVASLYSDIN